jgi:hypothetical protein
MSSLEKIKKSDLLKALELAEAHDEFGSYSWSKRRMFNVSGETKEFIDHTQLYRQQMQPKFIIDLIRSHLSALETLDKIGDITSAWEGKRTASYGDWELRALAREWTEKWSEE